MQWSISGCRQPDLCSLRVSTLVPIANTQESVFQPLVRMSAESVDFPDLPPFPSDVPTAPLFRLSLAKLLANDVDEVQRLLEASEKIGFFYLNLEDCHSGTDVLAEADTLFTTGEKLFALSLDEKKKYDFSGQNSYFGYKAQGAAIVDRQGNPDRNEFYNVSHLPMFI